MKWKMSNEKKLLKHELLGYPRFIIYQQKELFRFTIDSMLLSGFIEVKDGVKSIVDLGTGNAVIPIYLTLKTDAEIYGVEIQKEVYDLGAKSVKENNLENQIKLFNEDIKNTPKLFKNKEFDIVTCNPPFFKYQASSKINKNDFLTIARHEVKITLEEIIKVSYELLKDQGSLYLIHRPERLVDIISLMREYKLEPKIVRFVYPNKEKNANHILIKGVKNANKGSLKHLKPLYIYDEDNKLTEEVLEIYNYGRD